MRATVTNGSVREGAVYVDIYNDGLVVFLYDRANEALIRESDPKIIWYAGGDSFADGATRKLLEAGVLLIYGLHQDGGIEAEVVVGEPLGGAETAGKMWLPPETGFLSLPSGELCVHSYNTLPMGDNGDRPEDEGALVRVPAGSYKVTLYRADLAAAAEEAGFGINRDDAPEVIVLTPVAERRASSNVLFRHCLE